VEQRVDLMTLEQVSHLLAIADVGLDELVLLPGARRRPQVDVDDLLGLLARGQLVREPAADVSGAACDQVPHAAHPILADRPMSTSDRSPNPAAENPQNLAGTTCTATFPESAC
jgi:hypothetical protein